MLIAASRSRTPFPVSETQSAFGLFTQQGKTNPFQLKERGKSFIGVNNVTLSIITMRVSNDAVRLARSILQHSRKSIPPF